MARAADKQESVAASSRTLAASYLAASEGYFLLSLIELSKCGLCFNKVFKWATCTCLLFRTSHGSYGISS